MKLELSQASNFVVNHFIDNKIQSLVFKHDGKQQDKINGIKDAIDKGFLTISNIHGCLDMKVRATTKLIQIYKF